MLLIELSPSHQKRKTIHLQKRREQQMTVQRPEELQKRQERRLKKPERPPRKQEKPMKKLLGNSKPSRLRMRVMETERMVKKAQAATN